MESRKVVLMNPSVEQQWRHRHRGQNYEHRGKEKVEQTEKVAFRYINNHI